MAAIARPTETKKEIEFKGKKYIPITELQAYLNNPLLAKSGIKDKACKIRKKLEEGKDFIFLGSKEYSELMGYTSAKGGTLFTITGFNKAKAIANEKGYHEPTFDELPLIEPSSNYVDPRDAWVEKIHKKEEQERLEREKKSYKPKARVIRKPASKVKEEVKEEPKSIQPESISVTEPKPTETNVNVNMPNLKCDMNLMFERFMDVQLRQIEMWNKQIESLSGMVKDLIDLKVSKPESFKEEAIKLTNNITNKEENTEEHIFNPIIQKDYATYKKEINNVVTTIAALNTSLYPTRNGILSEAYKRLNKEYGVVWAQSKKEFYEKYKRNPADTKELCWFIELDPVYKDLLLCKLNTLYEEAKKEMEA